MIITRLNLIIGFFSLIAGFIFIYYHRPEYALLNFFLAGFNLGIVLFTNNKNS